MSKKLVQINVVCNGSTGRIMCDIAKTAEEKGYKTYCFYGRGNANQNANCIKIGNKLATYFHVLITRLFDKHGHGSYFATKKLINQLRTINPDIIHLHNIHGYYLNLGLLFKYLKNEYKGKTIWTLHDCWAFTGHCSYFTMAKCNKWKKGCNKCVQKGAYPKSIGLDSSKSEYIYKRKIFTGVPNLKLFTPSNWVTNLVKQSFLKGYPVSTIYNGVDLDIFKPTVNKEIYEKYNIPKDKKVIMGIANVWEERKGLAYFLDLNNKISDNEIILLVGLNDNQVKSLPNSMIKLKRVDSAQDLAVIYSLATVLYNPSVEETFSMVTAEAMACQTKVIVFDTSAPKELVDNSTGLVIEKVFNKEIKEVTKEVIEYLTKLPKKNDKNIKKFDKKEMINNYIKEYED